MELVRCSCEQFPPARFRAFRRQVLRARSARTLSEESIAPLIFEPSHPVAYARARCTEKRGYLALLQPGFDRVNRTQPTDFPFNRSQTRITAHKFDQRLPMVPTLHCNGHRRQA
jgi:hypothetical protein